MLPNKEHNFFVKYFRYFSGWRLGDRVDGTPLDKQMLRFVNIPRQLQNF